MFEFCLWVAVGVRTRKFEQNYCLIRQRTTGFDTGIRHKHINRLQTVPSRHSVRDKRPLISQKLSWKCNYWNGYDVSGFLRIGLHRGHRGIERTKKIALSCICVLAKY